MVSEIASEGLKGILRAGFDKATCRVSAGDLHELQAENGDINLFRTNVETDIGLSGIVGGRRASTSVNKSDATEISAAVASLKSMADAANQDPAFDIAEAQPAMTFEAGPQAPDYDQMYDRLRAFIDQVTARYPTINLRSASITFSRRQSSFKNSNGVDFESARGLYRASVSFSAREGNATSSMNYLGFTRFNLDEPLIDTMNMDEFLRQSTEQVTTTNLPGKFKGDLLISPTCLMSFLGFLTSRISDGPMISGTSVFKDRCGEQVGSDLLTMTSAPLSDELCGGYWITGDGYKADNMPVLENGQLKNYILGIYGANRTGLKRSANSGGAYIVEPGQTGFDELVESIDEGILINRFSGGAPNDRGDFSGIAKNSYYIKDGKLQFPVKETTVSGNLVDLLQVVRGVSRERLNSGGSLLPWVCTPGVIAS